MKNTEYIELTKKDKFIIHNCTIQKNVLKYGRYLIK
jgi:hypothetical protein